MIDIEKSVGFLLAKAYQRPVPYFKEEFDRYDLTPQQFGLLAFLWQEDGLSQTELSARSQIDRTTMGGIIDRLEKEGLIERRNHPEDRRAYQVFLTATGKVAGRGTLTRCRPRPGTGLTPPCAGRSRKPWSVCCEKLRH